MDIHRIYGPLIRRFRKKRMQHFKRTFPDSECPEVIDLGGGDLNWKLLDYRSKITLINLDPEIPHQGMELLIRDACNTELPSQSFALAFSNSLIEHLSSIGNQRRFADEMRRLAPRVWCQTPNKWFPVEPHLLGVLLHWLPGRWQFYWMIRYCTVWGLIIKPGREQVENFKKEVRLLTRREIQTLFPDCEIHTERFLGWPKAFIAIKRSPQTSSDYGVTATVDRYGTPAIGGRG